MKISFLKLISLSALLVMLFPSCTNRYEKQAMGNYEVGSYERKDSTIKEIINLPTLLTLNSNKTFLLSFKDSTIEGKWVANDYGDWTLVKFFIHDNKVQGQLGIDEISIINPIQFNCPQLKTLVFKKIKTK